MGYFYILDRSKDMIVTGGENVYCGEVEAIILTIQQSARRRFSEYPTLKWGELVAACVVLKPRMQLTRRD